MAEQIYEIEALRKRVLDALRIARRPMGAGELACALGVPTWAVLPAMESALRGELVVPVGDSQWELKTAPAAPARAAQADSGDLLEGCA